MPPKASPGHAGDSIREANIPPKTRPAPRERRAGGTIRASSETLKSTATEAKSKTASKAVGDGGVTSESDALTAVAPGQSVEAGSEHIETPPQPRAAKGSTPPVTASRGAAAAFIAARRKMAPPESGAGANVKGLVEVADKKMKKTVDGEETMVAGTPNVAEATPRAAAPAATPAPAKAAKPVSATKGQGFKTNEFIVYPAHGVGEIIAIEEQVVAGYKLELFVISFIKDKMILKVPLPKIASVGMRKLAEPAVVKRALDTLTGRARVKRTMWSRRAQEYEAKINSGDLVAIAEVVRDLYRSDAQPEQSYSERQLYEARSTASPVSWQPCRSSPTPKR